MAVRQLLREADIAEVMARFKRYRKAGKPIMEAVRLVAKDTELLEATVYSIQKRMRPTTEVATDYIKANSLKLAMRVVRKANVDQSIALLSRPNIGVLEPANGEGGMGGSRFMIGVAVDSLGGVKVGVQLEGPAPQALPAHDEGLEPLDYDPPDSSEGIEVGEIIEEEPKPRARTPKWHEPAPKPLPIAPVPKVEGRIMGQSVQVREAVAKAGAEELRLSAVKARNRIRKRMAEMAAEAPKV